MKTDILQLYPSSERVLEKSKGCYQYDSEGKEYLDFEAGVWCTNLGHGHDRIVKVIESQSKISIHHGYRFRNRHSEQLSVELQKCMGFENGASFFLCSGSEAVNLSMSIAKVISNRQKCLKISNSFLSAFGLGQISHENQNLLDLPINDYESILKLNWKEIAAVVLEVGGASIDVVSFPENDFIQSLVKHAKSNGCMIIAEEVTTGFGRLGRWFGYQHYSIEPDMVVTGKALGNGYPISAVTLNASTLHSLNRVSFTYGQSHQNDPLGCAIALEVIQVFREEQILENCNRMGNHFSLQLKSLQEKYQDKIRDVRARGLMLALQFQDSFDGNPFQQKLFDRGFVCGFKKNTLRFMPPLIIKENEIDRLVFAMEEIFAEL